MDEAALTERVRESIASTFGMDESEITDELSQDICARWTSLNHMTLMVALEDEFDRTFSMDEMTAMTSVPKIVAVLKKEAMPA